MSSAQGQVGEYRTVYINPISADDIKNVKLFSKMDVYVQASIAGYPRSTQTSSLDKNCGTHPRWRNNGRPMELVMDEPYLTRPGLSIRFDIKATSSLGADKEVGHVTVPIHDLFSAGAGGSQEKVVEYQVLTPSGRPQGSFKFSYRFGDKYQKPKAAENSSEPVTAYPASQYGGGYDKQHQQQHGYPPQQQPAYPYASASYPPQQAGYGGYGGGYPPQMSGYGGGYGYPQPPRRNSRMGGGMGMGLGAGLLGGLLVGDMISDASDYGDGYSDAMGDMGGGGFDF